MKIICIGRNYANHAKEMNSSIPTKPMIFMKPPTALLIEGRPFYYPEFSENIHYEAEMVLKICKNGRHVQEEFAHSYYEQVGFGIDFTARDLQAKCKEKGHPWEIAKSFDHSAGIGEFIHKSKLENPNEISFSLKKNGEFVQNGNTKDLIFRFDYLIAYVSTFFKLQVGDYIYTGTPEGVGPVQIGDVLEGYIQGKKCFHCSIK